MIYFVISSLAVISILPSSSLEDCHTRPARSGDVPARSASDVQPPIFLCHVHCTFILLALPCPVRFSPDPCASYAVPRPALQTHSFQWHCGAEALHTEPGLGYKHHPGELPGQAGRAG